MAENRNSLCGTGSHSIYSGDSVYIDVNRILDSCRDKDCFENVRVYLSDIGQEIIERAATIRAKSAVVLDTCISVSPMTFNRGFYQINMRIFVRLEFEVCVGGKPQCVEGLAVVEKNVILFGSEGGVRIFRSKSQNDPCCDPHSISGDADDNLPTAVLEIADPVVLNARIIEKCECKSSCVPCGCSCGCVCCSEIPDSVLRCLGGTLCDVPEIERVLVVSLGFFSVVRIERPAQFLVSATEYCVPDKECTFPEDDDPCSAFRRMAFPVEQICPPSIGQYPCFHDKKG
ncbi:MAG: hypothetical protein IJC98_00445 [Clostridia bacterium]|nr:hypothetical protein [Clostridia bacterium]